MYNHVLRKNFLIIKLLICVHCITLWTFCLYFYLHFNNLIFTLPLYIVNLLYYYFLIPLLDNYQLSTYINLNCNLIIFALKLQSMSDYMIEIIIVTMTNCIAFLWWTPIRVDSSPHELNLKDTVLCKIKHTISYSTDLYNTSPTILNNSNILNTKFRS